MWPRVVEFMLASWLAMSPFIFRYSTDAAAQWANDFIVAAIVGTLALLSFARRTAWAHWLIIPVAGWLVLFGRFAESPPSPGMENALTVGLLLLMFAIIPNHAHRPPQGWFSRPVERWNEQDGGK